MSAVVDVQRHAVNAAPALHEPCVLLKLGELVLTTLSKEAMPLVRYRTGDLVMLFDDPCPCGRTHRRISRVVGRVDDMLIVRGVNVFPSEVERVLMSFGQLSAHYQLAWEDALLDRLRVEVEAVAPLPPGQVGPLERAVTARLRDELGVTVETSVFAPMSLPRPEGKAVRVVDRRTRPS
jgi:phenylacetate-CoA ligase